MDIKIFKASEDDVPLLHKMQIQSFKVLLNKYKDYDTNPGNESIEKIIERFNLPSSTYWLIKSDDITVGGVRVTGKEEGKYRINQIFILPSEQGKGIGQETFKLLEEYYKDARSWELDTILEERGNCYLYEKMGYKKTGPLMKIKEGMTIVNYEKQTISNDICN